MVRITIDEEQKKLLLAAGQSAELCDASGRVIAHATPVPRGISDPWARFEDLTD